MKIKSIVVLIVFFVLFSSLVLAEQSSVQIKVYDVVSKEKIANTYISYVLKDSLSNYTMQKEHMLDENGTFSILLDNSQYNLQIKYDDLSTEGKDGFSQINLDITRDSVWNIYLQPAGSVQGVVTDKDGSPIKDALVRIDCVAEYGIQGTTYTNKMGAFFFNYLPTGKCKVGAAWGDAVGFKDVNIEKGKLLNVDINLNKNVSNGDNKYLTIIVIVVIILLVLLFAVITILNKKTSTSKRSARNSTTKSSINKTHTPTKKSEEKISQRTKDILSTLKNTEKDVVNYLLNNNYESTMAKMYYATGIPKTSLARIFQTLESKNIITTSRIGKLRKVKLTDWFSEKNNK